MNKCLASKERHDRIVKNITSSRKLLLPHSTSMGQSFLVRVLSVLFLSQHLAPIIVIPCFIVCPSCSTVSSVCVATRSLVEHLEDLNKYCSLKDERTMLKISGTMGKWWGEGKEGSTEARWLLLIPPTYFLSLECPAEKPPKIPLEDNRCQYPLKCFRSPLSTGYKWLRRMALGLLQSWVPSYTAIV